MSQSVLNLYQHIFLNQPDLSSLSLFSSVANPNQRVSDSSSFRSLLSCFATTPVSICVVFVWPHQYLFTILQSGNVFLNTLAAWFAVLKERLCSTWKPEKSSSAFTTFWFKFLGLVVELAPNHLIFFVVVQNLQIYPLCFEVSLCFWYHFLLHGQYWNRFHTQYITQSLHLS